MVRKNITVDADTFNGSLTKKSILCILLSVFSITEIHYTWIYKSNLPSSIQTITILSGLIFLVFVAYTLYCSKRENLFRSIERISQLHWGCQIWLLNVGSIPAKFAS
ncbi:hypothetical protein [Leptospira ilyithenensis]|uniref:Uncharacterized protein n=1 Tax=Leptospira ilyithenensis TaxID=2484901 RepID=A0A4R9LR44_9LEPT|nr:hypothetical protein [Leptospira ilyithenensis]TGN10450.1 hypothetical protein EHS11_09155 [Leptospira ilyithenensis]